jgi:hypothetical protein
MNSRGEGGREGKEIYIYLREQGVEGSEGGREEGGEQAIPVLYG